MWMLDLRVQQPGDGEVGTRNQETNPEAAFKKVPHVA
jgi:hypothetical protein